MRFSPDCVMVREWCFERNENRPEFCNVKVLIKAMLFETVDIFFVGYLNVINQPPF